MVTVQTHMRRFRRFRKSVPPSTANAPAPRRAGSDHKNALCDAFLSALADRVPRGGTITLPTEIVDAGELARVLAALDRANGVTK